MPKKCRFGDPCLYSNQPRDPQSLLPSPVTLIRSPRQVATPGCTKDPCQAPQLLGTSNLGVTSTCPRKPCLLPLAGQVVVSVCFKEFHPHSRPKGSHLCAALDPANTETCACLSHQLWERTPFTISPLAARKGPATCPTSSSSGSGRSGELGERSRSRTEGLLRIQARQMG